MCVCVCVYRKGAGLESAKGKPVEPKAKVTIPAELVTVLVYGNDVPNGIWVFALKSSFLLEISTLSTHLFCSESDFSNLTFFDLPPTLTFLLFLSPPSFPFFPILPLFT